MLIEPYICRVLGYDSDWKRQAFMASCCEPMLLNFNLYHLATGLGAPDVLRRALNMIWDGAQFGTLSRAAESLVRLSKEQSPGWFNEGKPYARVASQTSFAIAHTLRSVRAPSLLDVLEVADAAVYSIEIQYRNELHLPKRGRTDREYLIRSENIRLTKCLERLSVSPESDRRKGVARVRRAALRAAATVIRAKRTASSAAS